MRYIISLVLLLGFELGLAQEQPNILFIVTDDQGYGDLSLHGNPVLETPNLDRLGSQSVRFEQFHVSPVCATTRASLLTGRNHVETGVWGVHQARDYMRLDETTVAEVLRDGGYDTGMIGKWHNGRAGAWLPWNRGFNDAWVAELYRHRDTRIAHNGKLMLTRGPADEVLTDIALDFIGRERGERPFFLHLAYMTPHAPLVAPEAWVQKYRDKGQSETAAALNGMIGFLDLQIGRLLDGLEAAGLAENTLVVFLSDNGPQHKPPGLPPFTEEEIAIRNPGGMRGQKGNIWENGHRVPLFMRWPGKFAPRQIQALADVTDIFPTVVQLSGVTLASDHNPLHGKSLAGLLNGEASEWSAPRQLFKPYWTAFPRENWNREGALDPARLVYEEQVNALYRGPHKLVYYREQGPKLFNLAEDPGEQQDLAARHQEMAQEMAADLRGLYDEMRATGRAYWQPRFHIGHPGYDAQDKVGEVLAGSMIPFCSSVRDEGNVVTQSHSSKGWIAPGDAQSILVDVVTPGKYEVVLEAGRFAAGTRTRLEVGHSSLDLELPETTGEISVGKIDLAGGEQTLRLSLMAVAADGQDAIESMKMVTFRRDP